MCVPAAEGPQSIWSSGAWPTEKTKAYGTRPAKPRPGNIYWGCVTVRCRLAEKESKVFVETGRLVFWEGPKGTRAPRPVKRDYGCLGLFRAGKLPYLHVKQLLALPMGKGLYRDGYGRRVLAYKERFPCFDSYDRANEKRYYHWAYLVCAGRLICVYFEDENRCVTVTEDVAEVPGEHYEAMRDAGLVTEEGYLRL